MSKLGNEELSTVLTRRVNAFGELHLDKELTTLLIEWIKLLERTNAQSLALVKELREMIKSFSFTFPEVES